MARNTSIPPESFEEILAWLNPDRELAGAMYVQLRNDLAKLFIWRRCSDPEGMTDEVFDRVARKVATVRPTYEGDPRRYFHAVANNVIRENLKKIKTHVSWEDVNRWLQQTTENDNDEQAIAREECLQSCLQGLGNEKRELIRAYYAKQKQAKIDHRNKLAQDFGISLPALRVRVFRIREALETCIASCLRSKLQSQ